MKFIKSSHLAAATLLGCYGLLAARNPNLVFLIYWILLFIYAGIVAGVFRNIPWCIRVSLVPPLLLFLVSVPVVLYNVFAFMTGHPSYRDSPATIIVVAVVAVLVTFPTFLVLVAYWKNRDLWLKKDTQPENYYDFP